MRAPAKIDKAGKLRKERYFILSTNDDGYRVANLWANGKPRHIGVHRLVYEAFAGPIPEGHEVNHKNGVRHDNRPENLEALSHADNVRYSKSHLGADYATYGNRKLTRQSYELALKLSSEGVAQWRIAKQIGVSKATVWNAITGKTWANKEKLL